MSVDDCWILAGMCEASSAPLKGSASAALSGEDTYGLAGGCTRVHPYVRDAASRGQIAAARNSESCSSISINFFLAEESSAFALVSRREVRR